MGDAISLLERRGYFYDEVEREIETKFMPWLDKAMEEASQTRVLTDTIEQKIQEVALEIDDRQRGQFEIDTGVQCDQKTNKQFALNRRMLIEDLANQKIRKALEGKKKKTEHNEEEESEA